MLFTITGRRTVDARVACASIEGLSYIMPRACSRALDLTAGGVSPRFWRIGAYPGTVGFGQ